MNARKTAMVTGSSRGIGRGIALELARKGWNLILNYLHNESAAAEAENEVGSSGADCVTIQADVAQKPDRERLVQKGLERFGRIDLLVNNAGMGPRQRVDLLQVSEESFDEVLAANLKGPFFLTQVVARIMVDQIQAGAISGGRIINIGSISAYTASVERAEYCLSKAGMAMMTALFAARLADHNIQVYEIRPGIIETDMTQVAKGKYDRLIAEGLTPIRRWGKPEDVAVAVAALADGVLAFSTGEIINVDGGFHLKRL